MIVQNLKKMHPCLGDNKNKNARIHLPVSEICNIQCKFCKRNFNKIENRPGVSNSILSIDDVLPTIENAMNLYPNLTVVGIAGPGDSLADDKAIETFKIIDSKYPQLIKCLSTNGLLLSEKVKKLQKVGVSSITVTVNAIDPKILSKIVSYIIYNDKYYFGKEAASILISKQLEGIRLASEFAHVKANSVLIPGINDNHIREIAKTVRAKGAEKMNIIPLIPQHQLNKIPPPSIDSIHRVRNEASNFIDIFKNCKQCRADACGIPGDNGTLNLLNIEKSKTFSHG